MDKLYFEANVLNLYSEDYEYLQNQVEHESEKIYRQVVVPKTTAAMIRGFNYNLFLSSGVTPAIQVYSSTGYSAFLTTSGKIIESSLSYVETVSIPNDSIYYLVAGYETILGTYNKQTGTVTEGAAANIDYTTYTSVHDRQIEKMTVTLYPESTYLSLDMANKVLIVKLTGNGYGVLPDDDASGRVYVQQQLTDGSVTTTKLSPDIEIPQSYILGTVFSDINDDFPSGTTSTSLIDDLNKLRTELKGIKGTSNWNDPTPGTLLNFDKELTKLHADGNIDYGENFNPEYVTSSGTEYIRLNSGKVAIQGYIYGITAGASEVFQTSALPTSTVGNWSAKTGYETITWSVNTGYVVLAKYTDGYVIDDDNVNNIHVRLLDTTDCVPKEFMWQMANTVYSVDYYLEASTGRIYYPSLGRIAVAQTIQCYYNYGYTRYDAIELTAAGDFFLKEGTGATNPMPPDIDGTNLRILNAYRHPFITTTNADLYLGIRDIPRVRECNNVLANDISLVPYTPDKVTFYNATNQVDKYETTWIPSTVDGKPLVTTTTQNSYFVSNLRAKAGDELYLRCSYGPTSGNVSIEYASVAGSANLDVLVTQNLNSTAEASDILVYIGNGLTEGYHRVKVTVTGTGTHKIYGIVYGRLDTFYWKDNIRINNLLLGGVISTPVHVTDITDATTKDSASVITEGGMAAEKSIIAGLNITAGGNVTGTQLVSNVAQGTPPHVVTSTTQVNNLNSALLNGYTAAQIRTYDYIIQSQTEFDAVFVGTIPENTSIFLKQIASPYLLNGDVYISSNVKILSDGAVVNRNTATAKFVGFAKYTLGVSSGGALGDTELVMDAAASGFVVGDIVTYSSTEFYTVTNVTSATVTVTPAIYGHAASAASNLSALTIGLVTDGWTFDGKNNIHSQGGAYTALSGSGGAFNLAYFGNCELKATITNCSVTVNGGGILGTGCYNIEVQNVQHCHAGGSGGGVYGLSHSHVSNISNCYADSTGGGVALCLNSTIANISSCYANSSGGGVSSCQYSTIYNISNCSSALGGGVSSSDDANISNVNYCFALIGTGNGGGIYGCNNSTITNVSYCTSYGSGGGVYSCLHSNISNITYCTCTTTGEGGGVASSGYSTISNVAYCTATSQGGGVWGCDNSKISNITYCDAPTGGGVYGCDSSYISDINNCTGTNGAGCNLCHKSSITNVNNCAAVTSGGGIYNCDMTMLYGSWWDNTAGTSGPSIYASSSTNGYNGHISYQGNLLVSTAVWSKTNL